MGYNGFPAGVIDDPERYNDRPLKYRLIVHAEVNACLQAGHRAVGGTLYVYPSFGHPNVCSECAKVVIQSGIARVVGYKAEENNPKYASWQDSLKLSGQMFDEAGVLWGWIEP